MLKKLNNLDSKETILELLKNPLFNSCVVNFGDINHHNGLAVGWYSLGTLWQKSVATVFVKPNRYSFEFAEKNDYFSLVWFKEEHEKIVSYFGTVSGRDVNKDAALNLKTIDLDNTIGYENAKLIITCKKVFSHNIKKEEINDERIIKFPMYQDELYHCEYIGEIINVYYQENIK